MDSENNNTCKYNIRNKTKGIHTPAIKTVRIISENNDIQNNIKNDTYKENVSKGAEILTRLLLTRTFGGNSLKIKYPIEEDEDYIELEGKPDDIDYIEEEYEYLSKLPKETLNTIFSTEKKIIDFNKNNIPQRFKILNYDIDISMKSNILKKLDRYYTLEPTDNEFHKLGQWVEFLDKIPFGKYTSTTVTKSKSSPAEIVQYLNDIKNNLDTAVYGHHIAKNRILQIISQQITNPNCMGNCIAIQGPPGNGKTTLVREGISKSMNRPFFCIPLGGMQNGDYLLGHEYTYEGSKPGRIVEILMEGGRMDPIIYFDELDKLSNTPKGEEIANLLCHLTDLSQNNDFHDKYFSGISFDLSKAIFIFSYNDEKSINPILLDRMIKINTNGFKSEDKINISNQFLIPALCKSIGFEIKNIHFDNDNIRYIIENYTNKEKGVRNLRRCFESIISKINILNLIYQDKSTNAKKLVNFDIEHFSIPIKINNVIIDNLLKDTSNKSNIPSSMYL